MGSSLISASSEINLLGVDFDSNFSTKPFLHKLACAAQTRAKIISRLSYSMPPNGLSMLTNGLLMGKILSACPVTIPLRLNNLILSYKLYSSVTNLLPTLSLIRALTVHWNLEICTVLYTFMETHNR